MQERSTKPFRYGSGLHLVAKGLMNLLLSLALAATLAAQASPGSIGPDSGAVVFTDAVTWLHESPHWGSKRLALLPQGTQVQVIKCADQACRVSFRKLTGYVGEERLQTTTARAPVEPGRGYINSRGQWIPSPTHSPDDRPPAGATARCKDGSYSFSQSRRGTCSWHGGVAQWL
jgi:hypothetical protein